jgi:hypothetical protein
VESIIHLPQKVCIGGALFYERREGLLCLDSRSGKVVSLAIELTGPPGFTKINAIAINKSRLYLGGQFWSVHAAQVTLGELFESLGIRFTADCFVTDENIPYCDGPQGQLKFFVNGQSNTQFDAYIPKDLDRILIAYGNESPVQLRQELDAVTDNACIPSGKCLERGSPPDESSCTTQNGCVATGPLRAE